MPTRKGKREEGERGRRAKAIQKAASLTQAVALTQVVPPPGGGKDDLEALDGGSYGVKGWSSVCCA